MGAETGAHRRRAIATLSLGDGSCRSSGRSISAGTSAAGVESSSYASSIGMVSANPPARNMPLLGQMSAKKCKKMYHLKKLGGETGRLKPRAEFKKILPTLVEEARERTRPPAPTRHMPFCLSQSASPASDGGAVSSRRHSPGVHQAVKPASCTPDHRQNPYPG